MDIRQKFKDNFDCYADTWSFDKKGNPIGGDVIKAMTEDKFVEVVNEILATYKKALSTIDVGKHLLSELRKHYLIEVDFETGMPKADARTLMELWGKVNDFLVELKVIEKS